MADASEYRRRERLPWALLVDDLAGTVHQGYGGLADPAYLIDTEGRVAYANLWTSVPRLHEAIEALVAQQGRGVVNGGIDRVPHMLAAMTDGWRGLRRGLPQSFHDMLRAAGATPAAMWLGYQLRPVLAPLTLRARPLPTPVKAALVLAATLATTRMVLGSRAADRAGRGRRQGGGA